ncbi:MAG: hypothetical protein C5B52_16215 [Bacteroidetes bacterium]|nr:MAG: hypothetical protein C5B52_16215 [Bacteroidota bacterium]
MPNAVPIQQSERIVVVDIIRGFALTGVLFANFNSYLTQDMPGTVFKSISGYSDHFLEKFNTIFIEWKFMTLFSILFGYGFGLILNNLKKKNISPNIFFLRRMFWLFVIGLIHNAFWWGDVLHFYAISGALLLFFQKMKPATLLISSLLLMFVIPPIISYFFRDTPGFFTDENINRIYLAFRNGNLFEVFSANAKMYYPAFIVTGGDLHDITETLGRFLFGYFFLSINLFDALEKKKTLFRNAILITVPIAIAYYIVRWLSYNKVITTHPTYWEPLMKLGIISTTCFYVSTLTFLYIKFGKLKFFSMLQALGKMTLTNYLLVSVACITILYGIGFGQLGILPLHIMWLFAFIWWIIEIIFSTWWLKKFRYGPAEWIWRQLSYRKRFPIRK